MFAYLVARQAGGQFVLRLEDTDKTREVPGSREHLIGSLKALGLYYDEGPDVGGPAGPYIQSERLTIYHTWAQRLIESGRAYADPYTPDQIQALRDQARAEKRAFRYRDHRPDNPPVWDGSQPLRFRATPRSYTYHDEVMGDVTTSPEVVDDIILIKSDGYPTYNFAHIVDDAEMGISHVIRGQEFIASMPNYLALYEALGFAVDGESDGRPLPVFAHLPHIMNEQGTKKLGKRDGAKDVLEYIRDGYLPEALVSFIATLGWNDGTEQEIFNHDQLIAAFSLDRIQRSGARFDEKRLLWMNGQGIRSLALDDLSRRVEPFWPDSAHQHPEQYRRRVLTLAQDRLKTLRDLPTLTEYFFSDPTPDRQLIDTNKQLKKLTSQERVALLRVAHTALAQVESWTPPAIQATLNQLLASTGQKPAVLLSLIRVATTWAPFSPQLDETLALLGQGRTLGRLDQALTVV